MNQIRIMSISLFAGILIIAGSFLLVLSTLPVQNKVEGNELVVKFVIGKKVIDLTDAVVKPVPEETRHNIIRVGGTSIGKIHSGNFVNTKTQTRYTFYLTGKGQRTYFEIGDKKYLVDDVNLNK